MRRKGNRGKRNAKSEGEKDWKEDEKEEEVWKVMKREGGLREKDESQ